MGEGQAGRVAGRRPGGAQRELGRRLHRPGATTERGWEAEFAIPLKTLRYSPGEGRMWGVNVMRNIRRKNEQVFLSPVPRGTTCTGCRWPASSMA